jgi:hypothetical protein
METNNILRSTKGNEYSLKNVCVVLQDSLDAIPA